MPPEKALTTTSRDSATHRYPTGVGLRGLVVREPALRRLRHPLGGVAVAVEHDAVVLLEDVNHDLGKHGERA